MIYEAKMIGSRQLLEFVKATKKSRGQAGISPYMSNLYALSVMLSFAVAAIARLLTDFLHIAIDCAAISPPLLSKMPAVHVADECVK